MYSKELISPVALAMKVGISRTVLFGFFKLGKLTAVYDYYVGKQSFRKNFEISSSTKS